MNDNNTNNSTHEENNYIEENAEMFFDYESEEAEEEEVILPESTGAFKKTLFLILFWVSLFFTWALISVKIDTPSYYSYDTSGKILSFSILSLVATIFLFHLYKKTEISNISEYKNKLKIYHKNCRPLNWLRWQIFVMPFGCAYSLFTAIASRIYLNEYSYYLSNEYAASLKLSILSNIVCFIFSLLANCYIYELSKKSYYALLLTYIYPIIYFFINCISILTSTWQTRNFMSTTILATSIGSFIGSSLPFILTIIYLWKRKNLFTDFDISLYELPDYDTSKENLFLSKLSSIFTKKEKSEKVNTTTKKDVHKEPKTKYCRNCGNIVDSTTKKCSGCGKQYFKSIWTLYIVFALVTLTLSSVVVFLVNENSKKENSVKYWKAKYDTASSKAEKYDEILPEYNFYLEYAVIVPKDGSRTFHEYGCEKLGNSSFNIYNISAAESKGYTSCSSCHSGLLHELRKYMNN